MKRYFELIEENAVVQLDIKDGSPASITSGDKFKEYFHCNVREIDKSEFEELAEET